MSTYTKDHFDANNYEANRLTYSPEFVKELVEFHKKGQSTPQADSSGKIDVGVDVACGTGKFTTLMPPYFNQVIGTDLSQHMLDSAPKTADNIKYIACPAEALALEDNSADIVTVATGAHWFDSAKFVKEACRVLRPNGTLAIFSYLGLADFPKYPQVDAILREFAMGEEGLGPYSDNGLSNAHELYYEYMVALTSSQNRSCGPSEDNPNCCICWVDVERRAYPQAAMNIQNQRYGGSSTIKNDAHPAFELIDSKTTVTDSSFILDKKYITWNGIKKLFSSSSPYANYCKQNPDKPDILEKYIKMMMDAAGSTDINEVVEIKWWQVLILARCNKQA
ncbi:trans-aconitate methyltransferase 1 [Mycoemilia scoparia]|uniref:Trans-aconitate methyltransferase 1 n=1 Tax=Mycoemilia scoparia TaxID=417184 RepID=A0A9W7ZV60_9FUNG|nr:trans-aconitate methyltransferase 1 [Mycoemilia scoparia]